MNRKTFKCVVKTFDGCNEKYLSVIADFLMRKDNKEFFLEYQIGKTTKPNIGKIFVFDTLENAKYFRAVNHHHNIIILSGFATNVGKPKYVSLPYYFPLFWRRKLQKRKILAGLFDFARYCPKGTLTCDSFMPIKKVWPV